MRWLQSIGGVNSAQSHPGNNAGQARLRTHLPLPIPSLSCARISPPGVLAARAGRPPRMAGRRDTSPLRGEARAEIHWRPRLSVHLEPEDIGATVVTGDLERPLRRRRSLRDPV